MRWAATGKGTMRSTMRAVRAILLIGVMAATAAVAVAAGEPGKAGMLFLRLGVGAREAAMGGAGVASTSGAAASYWNPAFATYDAQGTSLLLQQHRLFGLFDHNAAALAHRTGQGVIGVTFIGLYSDGIDRYLTGPVGEPQGTFKPYDVAFGVSYSRQLTAQFAAGVQAKFLYEKIDIYSDWGVAFDVFLAHRSKVVPGLSVGASATNLGGQMTLNQEPFDLPQMFTLGVAYGPQSGVLANHFVLATDLALPNDGNAKAHLGAEAKLVPGFALRGGYRVNYDSQGLTAGVGFAYGVVGLDYAYEDITAEGIESGHKFSLRVDF
jgi:hypothetical protein